ncbi:unnamed protein product [marine sediment metagenome]|uniref:Uncharacterized protein n=1 Tax=marine sediment metagenome TaxID=412755 RepID=X1KAP0_9ZZZZ
MAITTTSTYTKRPEKLQSDCTEHPDKLQSELIAAEALEAFWTGVVDGLKKIKQECFPEKKPQPTE